MKLVSMAYSYDRTASDKDIGPEVEALSKLILQDAPYEEVVRLLNRLTQTLRSMGGSMRLRHIMKKETLQWYLSTPAYRKKLVEDLSKVVTDVQKSQELADAQKDVLPDVKKLIATLNEARTLAEKIQANPGASHIAHEMRRLRFDDSLSVLNSFVESVDRS